MRGSMLDMQSAAAEIRRGKKEEERKKKKSKDKKVQWPALLHRVAIMRKNNKKYRDHSCNR